MSLLFLIRLELQLFQVGTSNHFVLSINFCSPYFHWIQVFISALCNTRKMLELLPQQSSVGGEVPSLVFPCLCSWSHQPLSCSIAWRCSHRFDIVWGSGQCPGNGRRVFVTALHATVCRLGLYVTWHKLLFRWILFQWVYLAVVSKLSIKNSEYTQSQTCANTFLSHRTSMTKYQWMTGRCTEPSHSSQTAKQLVRFNFKNVYSLSWQLHCGAATSRWVHLPNALPKMLWSAERSWQNPTGAVLPLPRLILVLQAQVELGWKLHAGY